MYRPTAIRVYSTERGMLIVSLGEKQFAVCGINIGVELFHRMHRSVALPRFRIGGGYPAKCNV